MSIATSIMLLIFKIFIKFIKFHFKVNNNVLFFFTCNNNMVILFIGSISMPTFLFLCTCTITTKDTVKRNQMLSKEFPPIFSLLRSTIYNFITLSSLIPHSPSQTGYLFFNSASSSQ